MGRRISGWLLALLLAGQTLALAGETGGGFPGVTKPPDAAPNPTTPGAVTVARIPQTLMEGLAKRVTVNAVDKPLPDLLKDLSQKAGIPIRADLSPGKPIVYTVGFEELPVSTILTQIATQARCTIRPDLGAGRIGVSLTAFGGFASPMGPWSREWPSETLFRLIGAPPMGPGGTGFGSTWPGFGAMPGGLNAGFGMPGALGMPPSIRLTPQSVTALDATHFLVLSLNPDVGAPIRVSDGAQGVTVVMPMAVLTLYRIEGDRIVQVSSTLHQLPAGDLGRLVREMRPAPAAAPNTVDGLQTSTGN